MLVKEIKILLFYYQQSEFPCCPHLTKQRLAWLSSALSFAFCSPRAYSSSGCWQNLFVFSIFMVGLNVQIPHVFQTHYNCPESLRTITASVDMNNFWSILHVGKTTECISKTLLWNSLWAFFCLFTLLKCLSYLLDESISMVRNAYCFVFGSVFWLFKPAIFLCVGQ